MESAHFTDLWGSRASVPLIRWKVLLCGAVCNLYLWKVVELKLVFLIMTIWFYLEDVTEQV